MTKPLLYDVYCGAGGASRGYQLAGFRVVGIDNRPQPRYAGDEFVQMDAFAFFAAVQRGEFPEPAVWHSSPPCQAHSSMRTMPDAKTHPNLIPATRAALEASGKPYVIENVIGAPLPAGILLCGTMFGLGCEDAELRRHRLFESNVMMLTPSCRHGARSRTVLGMYGGHARNRSRTIGVYGEGVRDSVRKHDRGAKDFNVAQGREAMGIDWMTLAELCQAIPPAYTHYLGDQLMRVMLAADRPARPEGAAR